MADDLAFGDLGYYGNKVAKTPGLDAFARKSVRIERFYTSPVCSPTRSSLLTGRYPIETGIFDTYNGGSMMKSGEITLAEILKENGYSTGIFGKWHLGDNYPMRPQDQGFEEVVTHKGGGLGQPGDLLENFSREDSAYFNPCLLKNGEKQVFKGYCTDIFTREAIRFMERKREKPFFAYLAFNAPHTPLQVPENYLSKIDSLPSDSNQLKALGFPADMTPNQRKAARRLYAMVLNLDDNFRRLEEFLKQSNLLDNTLIIFISDNGPEQVRYNAGLRGRKTFVYEGGIRVPSFWFWKKGGLENRDVKARLSVLDVLPTLCEITGSKMPEGVRGRSFLKEVKSQRPNEPRSFLTYWNRGFPERFRNAALFNGDYKLVWNPRLGDSHPVALYDLENDPGEKNNLAQTDTVRLRQMKAEYDALYSSMMKGFSPEETRIRLGHPQEPVSILGRNDWRGPEGKDWRSPSSSGYWDIETEKAGDYEFEVKFIGKIEREGELILRMGTTQKSIPNRETGITTLQIPVTRLPKGPAKLECWYESGGKLIFPQQIKVISKL